MRAYLLAVVLAVPLAAQPSDPVEALASRLGLTDDQADLVAEILTPDDPGSVWTLAAELLPTLSADQREALFARPERPSVEASRRGRRGDRRRGQRDPSRAAIVRAARDAALGLDASTSADLDDVLEGMGRRERMRAVRGGEIPTGVEQLLTTAQIGVYRAHGALQRHVRRALRTSRRG